jgi:hypothetical protein
MFFFNTPNYSVALNAKVGSSSMARAIIAQFRPRVDFLIRTAEFPPGVTADDLQWHSEVGGSATPSKPVVLLVREPVSRFVTACQQVRIPQRDIVAAIASLVDNKPFVSTKPDDATAEEWEEIQSRRTAARMRRSRRRQERLAAGRAATPPADESLLRNNVHFFHQHGYIVGETTCFQFPRDIAEAAAFIGIEAPMPKANPAKRPKPTLTPEQESAVLAYYAEDVALFNSITSPATVVRK